MRIPSGQLLLSVVIMFLLYRGLRAADSPVSPAPGWQPDPKLLEALDKKKTLWLFREADIKPFQLPDPLLCADGIRITTREAWETKRRPETLDLFERCVFGRSAASGRVTFETLATDPKAIDGKATLKSVRITSSDAGKSFSFTAVLLVPNRRQGKVPAFLLINNRPPTSAGPSLQKKDDFWPVEEIIARGYATAIFQTGDVDPDEPAAAARTRGVRSVFTGPGKAGEDAWAAISAWAWGASRIMDYLQSDPDIDPAKIALVGHSRGGKTALWAGAQDTRFSLVVANGSGCGGAALSRRKFGETVARINRSFPYWFCENFRSYNDREEDLPIDQHQLIALIAPRAVYIASADADFWADQRGEFLGLAHSSPVYALYGFPGLAPADMPPLETPIVRGRMAYHIRRGGHDLTAYDWTCFLNFADRLWRSAATAPASLTADPAARGTPTAPAPPR